MKSNEKQEAVLAFCRCLREIKNKRFLDALLKELHSRRPLVKDSERINAE